MTKTDYDIIIIGAGPAGLSFARAMADTNLSIALVERSPESVLAAPPYDGRETALTHLSHDIMTKLGMWERIGEENISLIKHAKVLDGDSPYSLHFDHDEAGRDNLGFMVSNHNIRRAAYESLAPYENVTILDQTELSNLGTEGEHAWIKTADDKTLTAQLLIAADSRFSKARDIMNIPTDRLDFKRHCIVGTMKITGDHQDTAFECFHYDRTLAVLPLNNQNVSIVITLSEADSDMLMNMDEGEFNTDIERRTEGRFGSMSRNGKLHPYPLMGVFAKKFCAPRFALMGDAAVGMHPVTAHGFNLGLRGADTLATALKKTLDNGGEIGSLTPLKEYEHKHRIACAPLYYGTNALVKLYTNTSPPAKFARKALLHLGNRLGPAKKIIMNQLTEIGKAS